MFGGGGGMRSRPLPGALAANLANIVAKHLERLPRFADIGQRGDGPELVGALAQVFVHPRQRDVRGLDQAERLARIDGLDLQAVADQKQFLNAKRIGDRHQVAHRIVGDHRGFIEHQHRALEAGPSRVVAIALSGERVAGIGVDERRDGGRFDSGLFAQRPGDLVLEGEAQHLLAFGFGDAGDCGEAAGCGNSMPIHADQSSSPFDFSGVGAGCTGCTG